MQIVSISAEFFYPESQALKNLSIWGDSDISWNSFFF